jgi:hypothetical protein
LLRNVNYLKIDPCRINVKLISFRPPGLKNLTTDSSDIFCNTCKSFLGVMEKGIGFLSLDHIQYMSLTINVTLFSFKTEEMDEIENILQSSHKKFLSERPDIPKNEYPVLLISKRVIVSETCQI